MGYTIEIPIHFGKRKREVTLAPFSLPFSLPPPHPKPLRKIRDLCRLNEVFDPTKADVGMSFWWIILAGIIIICALWVFYHRNERGNQSELPLTHIDQDKQYFTFFGLEKVSGGAFLPLGISVFCSYYVTYRLQKHSENLELEFYVSIASTFLGLAAFGILVAVHCCNPTWTPPTSKKA
jgi:hypothetical protein